MTTVAEGFLSRSFLASVVFPPLLALHSRAKKDQPKVYKLPLYTHTHLELATSMYHKFTMHVWVGFTRNTESREYHCTMA